MINFFTDLPSFCHRVFGKKNDIFSFDVAVVNSGAHSYVTKRKFRENKRIFYNNINRRVQNPLHKPRVFSSF